MTNKQVANTILQQLGGNRFIAMTGAKMFTCTDQSLTFKIGRNHAGVNVVKIEYLAGLDLYTMTFENVRMVKKALNGVERKVINVTGQVYCDQLQSIFTSVTGMYTHL